MKKIVIIGGGVIGLCAAYYLMKDGHEVVVVDKSDMNAGASFVNSGYLTPSHFIPLAAPGVVRQGLKWMLNPTSPLYFKPRLNKSFLNWARAFYRSSSSDNVDNSVRVIKDFNLWSAQLFSELKTSEKMEFQLENKGLLILCQTEKKWKEELHVAGMARDLGLVVKELSARELSTIEPEARINAIAALHYQCDWHTTPHEFMKELYTNLEQKGVQFCKNEEVMSLKLSGKKITTVETSNRTIKADEFVLAAGSWSHLLLRKLGIRLLLEAGKGYRINLERNTGIGLPAILAEAKVAVTPMNGFTRIAGTMEIGGINHDINARRVNAIASAAENYYPDLKISQQEANEAACGLRPVSPDGKPYIGRSQKCDNLTIATGHAMMGWSLAPGTGKLISEVISGSKTTMDISAFHPDRMFN